MSDEQNNENNESEGGAENPSEQSDLQPTIDNLEETLGDSNDLTAVYNVPVTISAVLGRATLPVSQLLKLGRGAVVELDRRVGESVDIFVNNRLVARGEVVIVDERLGITMTEIIKSDR
ncbi:MAG: flagellar motor switch protein FliN [Candidatus Paracaedibacteraceae bacterium]|jgi:flagellar motor switch protein FliN/FliY|nr:flagellar motor switch protein FliN [Candidatus Paracaedibacteraceae bacterium]